MKRILILPIALFVLVFSTQVYAQSDLTFYHLGEVTPQANIYNPVFFPDAKLFISLPVISGVSVNYNNSFSYNDVLEKVSIGGKDSININIDKLISKLKDGDVLSFDGTISLLQIGFHLGSNSAVQIFANERYRSQLFYPVSLIEYLWNDKTDYFDQEVEQKNIRANAYYYREYGVGFSHQLEVFGDKRLRLGARFKYLQGIAKIQTSDGASASLLTESNTLNINIKTENVGFKTAGINMLNNIGDSIEYLISNENTGFGMDFGADFQINDKWQVALAVNDVGSILWKKDVDNYTLENTEAVFGGLDLKKSDLSAQAVLDTLEQLISYQEYGQAFESKLNTRVFVSGSYLILPKGKVTATIMARNNFGEMDYTYGFGYTHELGRVWTMSGTFSRVPTRGIGIGAALAARIGPVQIYSSIDNFIGFVESDVRNMYNANVRFGINFLFGRFTPSEKEQNEKKAKKVKKSYSPFPPEYELDHLDDVEN